MAILFINRTDSECGNCRKGADPYEKAHDSVLGWGPTMPGCGETFTAVGSHYRGEGMEEAVRRMRPDLPWTGDML